MSLRDDCQWVRKAGTGNEFWGRFGAAVVHNDDFETRPIRLLRQGPQASFQHGPVVVNGDNNTEQWRLIRNLFVLDHASSSIFGLPGDLRNVELHTQG
jgi:hypothetical protein